MKQLRSAKALLIDQDGYVLVLRRSGTHPRLAYTNDLPGGIIEDDESLESGLAREIFEETQIIIDSANLKLADTYLHDSSREGWRIERSMYIAQLSDRPTVAISWEHDQFQWVPLKDVKDIETQIQDQLDKVISSSVLPFLE